MQIAFHIGANCTDEDRLLKSVLRNADTLLQEGIAVPGPGRYRKLLREAIDALDGGRPTADARDVLVDAIVEDDKITRLVLSNDNFLTVPRRIFDHGVFYHQAEKKVHGLHSLFPNDDITLFMGMRHPASFLQETATRAGVTGLNEYLGLLPPLELRWSDVIRRIKRAAPRTPLYVWCNEDTPLIWEELIRLFSGVPADMPVAGQFDVLSGVVSAEGLALLTSRIAALDHDDVDARQDLIAEALETHALPEQLEESIDLPELNEDVVRAMTESYEADLDLIGRMEGVELILPFD